MRRILLLILMLSAVAWCRTPEAVVEEVFGCEQRLQNQQKTVARCAHCFTPGFLGLLERAFARKPADGRYVDWNIFGNSQTDTGHYEVGRADYSGRNATVPVRVWSGLRSRRTIQDRQARASWPYIVSARAHLTDVGSGWQIFDLEWLPRQDQPTIWVRKSVTAVAEGR